MWFKLVGLQVASLIGLLLGVYVAPATPVYPTIPSVDDMEYIRATEMQITAVTCFFSALAGLVFCYLKNLSFALGGISILFAGSFTVVLESLRFGSYAPPMQHVLVTYIGCTLFFLGFLYIVKYAVKKGE